jgi:hypothetical protein
MTNEEFIESVSLEGEIWKDIVGYEGLYMVSSLGRVVSLSRPTFNGACQYFTKPCIITSCPKSNGYLVVSIYKKPQQRKTHHVHRLVAEAFCENPYNKPHIDHINANKNDNRAENLRWVTQQENNKNPLSSIKISRTLKGKVGNKNSHPIVSINGSGEVVHYCSISVAGSLGFSRYKITRCCKGLADSYDGKKWMYLSDYETLNQ